MDDPQSNSICCLFFPNAGSGNRTRKGFLPEVFETSASTNSAIPAKSYESMLSCCTDVPQQTDGTPNWDSERHPIPNWRILPKSIRHSVLNAFTPSGTLKEVAIPSLKLTDPTLP